MKTQEERLLLLERMARDISHNETILLGMAVKHEELLRGLREELARVVEWLERVEGVLAEYGDRFDRLEGMLVQVLARLPGS